MTRTLSFSFILCLVALAIGGCNTGPKWSTSSDEALRAYEQGVTEMERFYYAESEKSLKHAIEADSLFALAWVRLAFLHSNLGNDAIARRESAHAMTLSAGATEHEQLLIRTLHYRITYKSDKAALVADSLIALYPQDSEGFLFRGQLYEQEKNIEAAVKMYERAVDADTGCALGVMSLGYAYSNLGEQDKAVVYMQRYIRMAPGVADPRASYGDILMRAGRYEDALDQFRASLQLKPDYWYSVGQIGRVYALLGRLKDAAREFDRSFSMVPQGPAIEAQRLRAYAYFDLQRGAYEAAAHKCKKSILLDSSVINGAYNLTFALAKLKEFAEAKKYIDESLEELKEKKLTDSPAMQGFHLMRARVLTEERQFDEAEKACLSALENSTPLQRGPVYIQLARMFLEAGRYEPALDAVEAALGVNPNAPDALLVLTKVYRVQGDRHMALEVGQRLSNLWVDADSDFLPGIELHRILGESRKPSGK
jgi:tetratricopeptide (TPR) repeat protein